MHYSGTTYRPPMEADTVLLQVTKGCSYNKCAFCTMYRKVPFSMAPEEEIIEDLQEVARTKPDVDRIFLLNGDPFVLAADKLLHIADLVRQYLPKVETLTCYCSIGDLKGKTFEELVALRKAGYNQMYIGLETGYEPAMQFITKGYSLADAEHELDRILKAGFDYRALLMLGIAGKGNSEANAASTAKLLNKFKPDMVSVTSTSVTPGTPLEALRDSGVYVQLTERELVEEELMLLRALEMRDDCFFHGSHPFNIVPIREYFAKKEDIILDIEMELMEYEPQFLDSIWDRGRI